jgi:AcrR family transcriptional regulator
MTFALRRALPNKGSDMSGNFAKMDARVLKTRKALIDAMVVLVREKGFDDIRLNDILAEAEVGRSTFYGHYADKDDLLISSSATMLRMADDAERAHYGDALPSVVPSAPVLRHIHEYSDFALRVASSSLFDAKMQVWERTLRAIAERRIADMYPHLAGPERARAAVFIAGAFVGIVKWWMQRGLKEDWHDLDRAFQNMIEAGLGPRRAPAQY